MWDEHLSLKIYLFFWTVPFTNCIIWINKTGNQDNQRRWSQRVICTEHNLAIPFIWPKWDSQQICLFTCNTMFKDQVYICIKTFFVLLEPGVILKNWLLKRNFTYRNWPEGWFFKNLEHSGSKQYFLHKSKNCFTIFLNYNILAPVTTLLLLQPHLSSCNQTLAHLATT